MRAKRIRLTVGSTHTLLKPTTVYVVTELRRVPNKRGTTSTTPVWVGACRDCGAEFEQPRITAPRTRRCGPCRGIPVYSEIPLDIPIDEHEREESLTVDQVNRAARAMRDIPKPAISQSTPNVFTDR